jgi:hypothetical protein
MPLVSYSTEHLIEEFHAFEAAVSHMTQEREIKFFFDLTKEKSNSAPSLPGYLSHLVCEEAQIGDDPAANNVLPSPPIPDFQNRRRRPSKTAAPQIAFNPTRVGTGWVS